MDRPLRSKDKTTAKTVGLWGNRLRRSEDSGIGHEGFGHGYRHTINGVFYASLLDLFSQERKNVYTLLRRNFSFRTILGVWGEICHIEDGPVAAFAVFVSELAPSASFYFLTWTRHFARKYFTSNEEIIAETNHYFDYLGVVWETLREVRGDLWINKKQWVVSQSDLSS